MASCCRGGPLTLECKIHCTHSVVLTAEEFRHVQEIVARRQPSLWAIRLRNRRNRSRLRAVDPWMSAIERDPWYSTLRDIQNLPVTNYRSDL